MGLSGNLDLCFRIPSTVATGDAKQLEYGPGTIWTLAPSFLGFGVAGQSYSNFLHSTAIRIIVYLGLLEPPTHSRLSYMSYGQHSLERFSRGHKGLRGCIQGVLIIAAMSYSQYHGELSIHV